MLERPRPGNAASDENGEPGERAHEPQICTMDYVQTVGYINLLTNVRFKLAAFVPALTGAAVALLNAADAGPLVQVLLGLGGLAFALGIVVYDLRNSQLYNGAIGRAMALEAALEFPRFEGDDRFGLFGSRSDTTDSHEAKGTDKFLGFAVRHGTGLALVYTATLTAWVWVVLDALSDGLTGADWDASWPPAEWLLADRNTDSVAGALTLASAALIWKAYRVHDRDENSRPAVLIHLTRAEFKKLDRLVKRCGSSRQEVLHDAFAASREKAPESDNPKVESEEERDRKVPLRLKTAEMNALTPWSEQSEDLVRNALIAYLHTHGEEGPAEGT